VNGYRVFSSFHQYIESIFAVESLLMNTYTYFRSLGLKIQNGDNINISRSQDKLC